MQFPDFKPEAFLTAEPQAQAQAEGVGQVPAFPLHSQGGVQIQVRQEIRPVQAPVGGAGNPQVPGNDPFGDDRDAQQLAQISQDQAFVQLLQDFGEEAVPKAAVHIVSHRHLPGFQRTAGLVGP